MKVTKFPKEDAEWLLSLVHRFAQQKEEFEQAHIWTGEKHTPDLTRATVSRLVRADINAAIRSGHLPDGKYRLSTRRSKVSKRKVEADSVSEFELVIRTGVDVEVGKLEEIAQPYNRSRVEKGANFQAKLFFQVVQCRMS